ncbi:hypothetical protein SS50377_23435 [Spironucleus salmonicida]|uniref:Uncharacterized protein n=1 Tax=Spironucleus salmonicida TaxID=348837 RepID=V6LND6_9EUKA|nr:hypothetical protein SS50377_23435 [Spironucleus salmonicida]|eukprot:EST46172.1 Hypothetical protein SS50377_13765 [Spironucleus salmonicida]
MEFKLLQQHEELTYAEAIKELGSFKESCKTTKTNEFYLSQVQTLIEAIQYEQENPELFQ